MDEIKKVDDIDPGILYQIQHLLREKRWYELLKASSINSLDFSKYIQKTGNGKRVNLERTFLDYCANVPIQEFIRWLETIHLEEALLLLKVDEPLKVIEEPNRIIEVIENEKLTLSCKAQGFPTPKYEWFHDGRKLFEGAVLEISQTGFADDGVYYCQVSNVSRNGIETMVFTSGTRVIVNPPQVSNLPKVEPLPYSPTTQKVYPERTFTLTCKATSKYPLSYQWYCNANELKGENSPQLDIKFHSNDIYEKKRLECVVTNKYGSVASNSIILELEPEDKEYYAEDKFALLIGNSQYDYLSPLTQPAKDVCTLSKLLQSIGFKTFCFQNLTCKEMRNAIKMFSSFLRPGIYALFYFAGHGYQQPRRYSLLGKEFQDIVKDESICPEEILNFMQQGKPEVNVILLDACRKRSSETDGNAVITGEMFEHGMLGNTIFGYATSSLYGAYEVEGQSSIFVQYLKIHIRECISIREMLFKVIEDVKNDHASCSLQHPYLKVSLTSPLKLTDSIIGQGDIYELEMKRWRTITGVPKKQTTSLQSLGISISILFSPYQDVFCNALTIDVYLTAMLGYKADDYAVHIKFYNVAYKEQQPAPTDSKVRPAFSISIFNLQSQEAIWGKLSVCHKHRNSMCHEEEICVVPMIAKALAHYM